MKRNMFILLPITVLILLALTSCAKKYTVSDIPDGAAAIVNGEAVTNEEVSYFENVLKDEVANYFVHQYSAKKDDEFWNTKYGTSTPKEKLYAKAKEQAIDAKKTLLFLKEKEIFDSISFEYFSKAAKSLNENSGLNLESDEFYSYYIEVGTNELYECYGSESEAKEALEKFKEKCTVILKEE